MQEDEIERLRNAIENHELNSRYYYGDMRAALLYILDDYFYSVRLKDVVDDLEATVEGLNDEVGELSVELERREAEVEKLQAEIDKLKRKKRC